MKQKNLRRSQGFTFIELLVVMAVIGLLASMFMVLFKEARIKAKDSKRVSDKEAVIRALNLYYDAAGRWPTPSATWVCLAPTSESCADWWGYSGSDSLVTSLQPYLPVLPRNNANPETAAHDRILYWGNAPAGAVYSESLPGAYITWFQERPPTSPELCPSVKGMRFSNDSYYCHQFLGPP